MDLERIMNKGQIIDDVGLRAADNQAIPLQVVQVLFRICCILSQKVENWQRRREHDQRLSPNISGYSLLKYQQQYMLRVNLAFASSPTFLL